MDNVSSLAICISLNNQLCMARPTLIDLNPDEYNQGLRCYPFMVNLDMCNWSCNTLDNMSRRIRVLSKLEDVNLSVSNTLTRINESRTLTKHLLMQM